MKHKDNVITQLDLIVDQVNSMKHSTENNISNPMDIINFKDVLIKKLGNIFQQINTDSDMRYRVNILNSIQLVINYVQSFNPTSSTLTINDVSSWLSSVAKRTDSISDLVGLEENDFSIAGKF